MKIKTCLLTDTDKIMEWAKRYAKHMGKQFIRLDALGNNTKLIAHYTSVGYIFCGMFKLTETTTLPRRTKLLSV